MVFIIGSLREFGLTSGLAHPAPNLTGVTVAEEGVTGKQLQLLKEMIPTATHVALLLQPGNVTHERAVPESQAAAKALNLRLLVLKATTAEEMERAFTTAVNARVDAIHVYGHQEWGPHGLRIPALALSRRLPSMSYFPGYADSGGLMSYGQSTRGIPGRMAAKVDRILKGARPTDLPMEQATEYDLVINLRTAKELGLQVPPSLLGRAHEDHRMSLDRRGRLLLVTVGAALLPLPDEPAVRALHHWLDTWRGIGDLEAGMARQGYDLQLARYADQGWRATFFITGREHSPHGATGSAWERTPWRAVQAAARDALRKVG